MNDDRIAFIGGGNMTLAIVGGMLRNGYPPDHVAIAEPAIEQREKLAAALCGIVTTDNNTDAIKTASTIVLAVKPQIVPQVCRQLATVVHKSSPLIISIAAGLRIADIDEWLGGGNAIARVMPNQPALLRQGASGIFANDVVSPQQLNIAERIMSAVGTVVTVPKEIDIDAVTAVSGSGPAYFYLLIDMIIKTGVELGLDEATASKLAVQTAVGASTLAKNADDTMDDLITRVRSPGGTTAAALDSLHDNGVRDIFAQALTAARDRATELADQAQNRTQD